MKTGGFYFIYILEKKIMLHVLTTRIKELNRVQNKE